MTESSQNSLPGYARGERCQEHPYDTGDPAGSAARRRSVLLDMMIVLGLSVALVTCVNGLYVSRYLSRHVKSQQLDQFLRLEASEKPEELAYLFLGDSHTLSGIDPEVIHGSFNFGSAGETTELTYFKLRGILASGKVRIRRIVLQMDQHSLSSSAVDQRSYLEDLRYYTHFVPVSVLRDNYNESSLLLRIRRLFPVIGNGDKLFLSPWNAPAAKVVRGWSTDESRFSSKGVDAGTRIAERTIDAWTKGHKQISEQGLRYVIELLTLARDHGIEVVILRFPVSKTYKDVLGRKGLMSRDRFYDHVLSAIREKVSLSYEQIDFYDVFEGHPEYFADSNHLNGEGAMVFSQMVSDRLRRLHDQRSTETP